MWWYLNLCIFHQWIIRRNKNKDWKFLFVALLHVYYCAHTKLIVGFCFVLFCFVLVFVFISFLLSFCLSVDSASTQIESMFESVVWINEWMNRGKRIKYTKEKRIKVKFNLKHLKYLGDSAISISLRSIIFSHKLSAAPAYILPNVLH